MDNENYGKQLGQVKLLKHKQITKTLNFKLN